jgi:hypothetical protein
MQANELMTANVIASCDFEGLGDAKTELALAAHVEPADGYAGIDTQQHAGSTGARGHCSQTLELAQ